MLKTTYRQYQQYAKVQTMLKNNLISLLDAAFPEANRLFTSPARADVVHLRKSNTEPIIRIYSEAHTMEEAEKLANSIKTIMEDMTK